MKEPKFFVDFTKSSKPGKVVYFADEYSFDTIGAHASCHSVYMINGLQIGFSENNEAVKIWGLLSHVTWEKKLLNNPVDDFVQYAGSLNCEDDLTPGIVEGIENEKFSVPFYDHEKNLLQLGDIEGVDVRYVKFMENSVAAIEHGVLIGLVISDIQLSKKPTSSTW